VTDSIVDRIRGQIAETDRALVETINERLRLVRALWRHKEERGLPMLDPAREEQMLRYLTEANGGPLSTEGLAEFYAHVLDLTKREAAHLTEA
jgi:chorismate mutase